MKYPFIEFYVTYPYRDAIIELPEDEVGTLYAVNRNLDKGNVAWFNDFTKRWSSSHLNGDNINESSKEFTRVDDIFDNGHISVKVALEDTKYTPLSLVSRFPKWFQPVNQPKQETTIDIQPESM